MKSEKHKSYWLLEDENEDVSAIANAFEKEILSKCKGENVVINLLEHKSLNLPQLLIFLKLSNTHRGSGHSFIIANNALSTIDIPTEMVVVPSLQEAEDIIEIEEIERDLGI